MGAPFNSIFGIDKSYHSKREAIRQLSHIFVSHLSRCYSNGKSRFIVSHVSLKIMFSLHFFGKNPWLGPDDPEWWCLQLFSVSCLPVEYGWTKSGREAISTPLSIYDRKLGEHV